MPINNKSRSSVSRCAQGARRSPVFELKPWYHNIPDKELIADLRRVARLLGVKTMFRNTYRAHSRFGDGTLTERFGSWNAALKKAGLRQSKNRNVPPELIVADIRRVARKLDTTWLGGIEYAAQGKYSRTLIRNSFGTWSAAVEAAGIHPNHYKNPSVGELFENLEKVWRTLGRQPTRAEMVHPLSKFSMYGYDIRYRGFRNALTAFVKWKARNRDRKCPAPPRRPKQPAIGRHKTGRKVNYRLRYLILRRDHFKCRACGRSPATEADVRLQVDHIKAWSTGGETVPANLQTLCERCNIGKSNL